MRSAIILTYFFFIICAMKRNLIVLAGFAFILISFITCKKHTDIWNADGSYTFYAANSFDIKCKEPLAVFVDYNNNFHIYEKKNRIHFITCSKTRFIQELSRICAANYYDRITVLTLCSGYNKQTKIIETLNDITLVSKTEYETKENVTYITAHSLERPSPQLRFLFSTDFMYCTCQGG